jgi:hypothetical protein
MAGRERCTMELLEQFKNKEPMYENMPNKYIDGMDKIIKLNTRAIAANYNRQLDISSLIDAICLDLGIDSTKIWNYKFPITMSLIHNDTEIRVVFSWGKGHAQLDLSFDDYESLPSVTSK